MAYIISSGESSDGIILENDSMTVLNGGTANNTTVNSYSWLDVSSGGTANDITVNSGGRLYVYSDGTANSTTINSSGYLYVSSGGTATVVFNPWQGSISSGNGAEITYLERDANVYYGVGIIGLVSKADIMDSLRIEPGFNAIVYSNGIANSTTVSFDGNLIVSSGGTANDTTVNSCGYLRVSSGGTANSTTVNGGGHLYVSSGGTANSTTVNSGGSMFVSSGGTANSTTVSSGGSMFVSSGGTANNTTVNKTGYLNVYSGGTATVVFNPWQGRISSGNGAEITYLERDANVYYGVSRIGLVSKADIMDSRRIESGLSAIVYSNGIANSTTVNGGNLIVSSGGTANSTTVNSGGRLIVSSGGMANSTTVNPYGSMYVSSGGKVTGKMDFQGGANILTYEGAILDFDLTQTESGAEAIVNDLSVIQGTPLYTLTVDGTQADGVYSLAEGAANFNSTISVVNTAGDELGTLSVGETVTIDDADYTLNLTGELLSVEIVSSVVPVFEGTFYEGDFNGDGYDMLAVQKDRSITIYMNGEPWGLGVTLDPGWEIAGVGDFNGDLVDDFLRVNEEGYVVGEMSNGNGTFSPQVLNLKNAGWDILGVGDFNGNGADDVLVANPTGASEVVGLLGYWEGGTTWVLINGYSAEWEMIATGDFNADGNCDMLWRNSFEGENGQTYNAYCTWLVGLPEDPTGAPQDWFIVSVANPDEWNFLCSGDFDGDGSFDIAMINDVGVVGIWGVSDGYLSSWSILSAVNPAEWQLAGVADFNGDGTDDIAWCNVTTGLTGYWQINDKQLTAWANIATIA